MWDYSEKVRDHYLNPRNVGEIENADGVGEVGNLTCGDALRLSFKLDDNGKIAEARFKTFGCGSAIASASVLTELLKGKSLEEAAAISNKEIAEALGGLPQEKMHCSVMGQEALEAAIQYYKTGGQTTTAPEKEGHIVCTCFNVTDKEIERAIKDNNLTTVEDVTNYTKAGGGCGGCIGEIQEILDRVRGDMTEHAPKVAPKLTTLQKIDKIRTTIEQEVRPLLQQDGGDCELVDLEGNVVYVQFKGHCKGCAFSSRTLQGVVEKKLKERVLPDLIVKEAQEQ